MVSESTAVDTEGFKNTLEKNVNTKVKNIPVHIGKRWVILIKGKDHRSSIQSKILTPKMNEKINKKSKCSNAVCWC